MFKRFLFITAAVMGVGWLSIPTASSPEIVEVTPEQILQPTLTSGVAFKDRIKLPNNIERILKQKIDGFLWNGALVNFRQNYMLIALASLINHV